MTSRVEEAWRCKPNEMEGKGPQASRGRKGRMSCQTNSEHDVVQIVHISAHFSTLVHMHRETFAGPQPLV